MKITAEKDINIYQLIVHGDFYDYKKGSYMLSLLELAKAYETIDVALVNRILLGGGLFQVAERLINATVACELIKKTDNGYVLTQYGRDSLDESHAWSPLYKSIMTIGILDFMAPGSTESYHLHPVAKVDNDDSYDKFQSFESQKAPELIQNFVNHLKQKKKWTAFTNKNDSFEPSGRSFPSLFLPSDGGQFFWNSLAANVTLSWNDSNSAAGASWTIKSVRTLNQYRTPLKTILEQIAGQNITVDARLNLIEDLFKNGFQQQPNGSFCYLGSDSLERKILDLEKLTFVQLIKIDGWSYRIEGKLSAVSLEQALQWYFAKYIKLDAVFELHKLRQDFESYARKAGLSGEVTDEQLRTSFIAWSSAPNRAVNSRRGFFLHFP